MVEKEESEGEAIIDTHHGVTPGRRVLKTGMSAELRMVVVCGQRGLPACWEQGCSSDQQGPRSRACMWTGSARVAWGVLVDYEVRTKKLGANTSVSSNRPRNLGKIAETRSKSKSLNWRDGFERFFPPNKVWRLKVYQEGSSRGRGC